MKTIFNHIVIVICMCSHMAMGTDLNKILIDMERMKHDLNQQQEALNQSMRDLGLGIFPGSDGIKKKSSHDKFIDLPEPLKGRAFFHKSCDCQDLVKNGHFCGSHALAHGVDLEQTYGISSYDGHTENVVQKAFAKLKIGVDKQSLISTSNIRQVATELHLDHIFVQLNNGNIESIFQEGNELPVVTAFKKLELMRSDLFMPYKNVVVKHVFSVYQVADEQGNLVNHVALFSIVLDKDGIFMTLHDNLNQAIKIGEPLFAFADKLIQFFVEANKLEVIYGGLLSKLVSRDDRKRYQDKLMGYKRASEREALLEHIFELWLGNTKEATNQAHNLDLRALNEPLKVLKTLFVSEPIMAKKMIIQLYGAMIDSVTKHKDSSTAEKIAQAEKITKAIRNTAKDQGIFILKSDAEAQELFERSQALLTSLRY